MTDEESDRYDLMHEWSIDQYFLSLEDPDFYETNNRHTDSSLYVNPSLIAHRIWSAGD